MNIIIKYIIYLIVSIILVFTILGDELTNKKG